MRAVIWQKFVRKRGFGLDVLAALRMLMLIINIIFDGIFGGQHGRVGKRMRGGGYRRMSYSGYGGGFFASIFAAALSRVLGCSIEDLLENPMV